MSRIPADRGAFIKNEGKILRISIEGASFTRCDRIPEPEATLVYRVAFISKLGVNLDKASFLVRTDRILELEATSRISADRRAMSF